MNKKPEVNVYLPTAMVSYLVASLLPSPAIRGMALALAGLTLAFAGTTLALPCAAKQQQRVEMKQMFKIGDDIVSVEAGQAFSKAQQLIDSRNYAEAVTVLKALIEKEPNLASAHYKLGFVLLQLSKDAEAQAEAKTCTGLAPTFFGGWALLGESSANLKQTDLAITSYMKALELQPTGENADIVRENLQELQNPPANSADAIETAAENETFNAQNKENMRINRAFSLCNQASDLFSQKKYEDGLQACRDALTIAPESNQVKESFAVYLNNYAADCIQKEDVKHAETLMKEAIAFQKKGGVTASTCLTTLTNYERLLRFQGRTDEAQTILAQIKSLKK